MDTTDNVGNIKTLMFFGTGSRNKRQIFMEDIYTKIPQTGTKCYHDDYKDQLKMIPNLKKTLLRYEN